MDSTSLCCTCTERHKVYMDQTVLYLAPQSRAFSRHIICYNSHQTGWSKLLQDVIAAGSPLQTTSFAWSTPLCVLLCELCKLSRKTKRWRHDATNDTTPQLHLTRLIVRFATCRYGPQTIRAAGGHFRARKHSELKPPL